MSPPFRFVHQRWQTLPLLGKLLFPIVGLLTLSLIVSTFAFFFYTNYTRTRWLERQYEDDAARVIAALQQRANTMVTAARMLSKDPGLVKELSSNATEGLNRRAVVVRDRFSLDLLQVHTAGGVARANLLTSSLYRVSSLLTTVRDTDRPVVRVVAGRPLLLMQASVEGGIGTVITGIDLETELHRVIAQEHLPAVLILCVDDSLVSTATQSDAQCDDTGDQYSRTQVFQLGDTAVGLTVLRPMSDLASLTDAGFLVLLVSTVGTSLLLMLVAVAVVRSVTRPLRRLAESARAVTDGDWDHLSGVEQLPGYDVGCTQVDEINHLARAFQTMLHRLRHLYADLENKVAQRTRDLAATEERYRRLFDEALTGYFIATVDGVLTACNPAFAGMFGFATPADAVGRDLCSLHADPAECRLLLDLVARQGRLDSYAAELRHSDGRPVYVIANLLAAFDADGRVQEIRGYLFDNTERKKLEDQLRQAQKMEAIGRLAGGIAHDFNNMLTVIIGYSELLSHRLGLPPDDPMFKQIETIRTTGERAATLTRQLLAFSRKQVLQPQVLDLNEVVSQMETMLSRLVGEDIVVRAVLSPCPLWVRADRAQIEQVIMNLSVNARDAMPDGGRLMLETAHLNLRAGFLAKDAPGGAYVVLSVSDTGVGMPEEVLDHIFEPFFTTKEVGKGTGLGLSTVYGIIEQTGGHIHVSSEVGKGSEFRIYLPEVQPAQPVVDDQCSPTASVPGGTETILLVEDEDVVRQFTATILRQSGYRVLEACHGADALRIAQEHTGVIDLMLTDVVMPGMNGRDLASAMAALLPGVRVLYMSGYTDVAMTQHRSLEPDVAFVSKPFTPDLLLCKVRSLLNVTGPSNVGVGPAVCVPRIDRRTRDHPSGWKERQDEFDDHPLCVSHRSDSGTGSNGRLSRHTHAGPDADNDTVEWQAHVCRQHDGPAAGGATG